MPFTGVRFFVALAAIAASWACTQSAIDPACRRLDGGACCYLRRTDVEAVLGEPMQAGLETREAGHSTCTFLSVEPMQQRRVVLIWYPPATSNHGKSAEATWRAAVNGLPGFWFQSLPGLEGTAYWAKPVLYVGKDRYYFSLQAPPTEGQAEYFRQRELARWVLRRLVALGVLPRHAT